MIGVSVKNFSISFANTKILENISFDVKQGEILTILGHSGCGKTTILRSIASLEDSYIGEIFVNEYCLIKDGKGDCHKDIGYIFQDYALFPHLNVKQNIEISLYKLKREEKEQRVSDILKQFDLYEHRNKRIDELSGGQQQRVSIARVLVYKPMVLLLDEPFANLDTFLRNKTKIWLKKLIKKLGLSAILVTHDQKEALSMSDKIAIINNKTIEQMGTPKQLLFKPKSLCVANFLSKVNELPLQLLRDLKIDIKEEYAGVISYEKIKIVKGKTKIRGKILDVSFYDEYSEIDIYLEDYNKQIIVKTSSQEEFENDTLCYLDMDIADIKIVKR